MKDWMFRKLDTEEEEQFRQWARDNFVPDEEPDPLWHPIIRNEWQKLASSEGTVIHGTYREEDLVPSFLEKLAELNCGKAQELENMMYDEEIEHGTEAMFEFLETLFDALNECAPNGMYFGAHEGDGSDFGFWRIPEEDI